MRKAKVAVPSYKERMLLHLAAYKKVVLGISESGTWDRGGRSTPVAHILPKAQAKQNLVGPLRNECWAYVTDPKRRIKRHQYFHHLNSSQAMAFNLFFPFISEDGTRMGVLQKLLGLTSSPVTPTFEKVYDRRENTNFDFCLETPQGPTALFEIKLTEDGFGEADAEDEAKYRRKLREFHHDALSAHVDASWLELNSFMARYQVLRNLSYTCRFPESRLFFVIPKDNETLRPAMEELPSICSTGLAKRVRVYYLEDLVEQLEETSGDGTFLIHWKHFRQKYLFGPLTRKLT